MKKLFHSRLLRASAISAALLAAPAAVSLRGAEAEPPKKEISDDVAGELAKLKEKVDAKDYAGAVKLLDGLLAKAKPESYDTAMVSQIKAQILLTEGKYADAVPALITAQNLGDKYEFFDQRTQIDRLYLLGQIHYQLATDAKDPVRQGEFFAKASDFIAKWLKVTPKPTAEGQMFAASVYYAHATLNPAKPDLNLLREARAAANRSLYLTAKPQDQVYILLLACAQQLGDQAATADLLEFLVTRQPTNPNYWQQLAGTYQQLAAQATDDKESKRLQLRIILALQRAQSNGLLNTPRDNLNLIGMYFNIEQFGKAGDLLAAGLKSGSVESTRGNWEMLSLAHQQNGRDDLALDTLKKAADLFPTEGQLELSIAQMYYGTGKTQDAFEHLDRAVTKGNLKKPGGTYLFLGLVAYELQNYEKAVKCAELAAKDPEVKPEDAARLGRAASEAIKDREAFKNSKT